MSGNIKNYDWSKIHLKVLKNIIMQVILSLYTAYITKGFLHQDIHLENILLKSNTKEIKYTLKDNYYELPYINLKIKIIDYGNSRFVNNLNNTSNNIFNNDLTNFLIRLTFLKVNEKFKSKIKKIISDIVEGDPEKYINNLLNSIHDLPEFKILPMES